MVSGSATTSQPTPPPPAGTPRNPNPASATYVSLPTLGSKHAPKQFKSHKPWTLDHFLKRYELLCEQNNVTSSEQKCLGILQYCDEEAVTTIEVSQSFKNKDFDKLAEELYWLYDVDKKDSCYHTGHLDRFTKVWRGTEITSLEKFKQYQRGFMEIAGTLQINGIIEDREYNQWFWAGLPRGT